MSVKDTFFFMQKPQQTDFEMVLKFRWNPSELVVCKWWMDQNPYSRIELVYEMEDQKV